jgi:hypothetical protein
MKQNIILNLLIGVMIICCGLSVWFVWKGSPSKIEIPKIESKAVNNEIKSENKEIVETNVPKIEQKNISEQSLTKQEIMTYVVSDISSLVRKISSQECSCGSWKVKSFGFISSEDVYVEYDHNGKLSQILIHCTGADSNIKADVLALFEPGEDMWNLVKGEDTQFGKKIEFYQQNEKGEWASIHK